MVGIQDLNSDQMSSKFEEMLSTIRQVNEQFKNAVSAVTKIYNPSLIFVWLWLMIVLTGFFLFLYKYIFSEEWHPW